MTAWRIRAILLPSGETVEAGISAAGAWTETPAADAESLPGRFVLPGLVDAHCHLGVARDDQGQPTGVEVAAAAAKLASLIAAGVTGIRDTGGPVGVTLELAAREDKLGLLVCGRFLAPPGQYYPALYEPIPADDLVEAA